MVDYAVVAEIGSRSKVVQRRLTGVVEGVGCIQTVL